MRRTNGPGKRRIVVSDDEAKDFFGKDASRLMSARY